MTTMTESLPSYSREALSSVVPPMLPPCYSSQPHADEETVAYTPRVANPTPHGLFIRQWPQATLILKGQDEGSRQPTYGRAGRIVGELGIANPEKIVKVTVKVCRILFYLRVHFPSRDEVVVNDVCLVLFSLLSCLRLLECLRSIYFYISHRKLNGQMSLSVADSGPVWFTLVAQTSVLWKHEPEQTHQDGSKVEQRCPSVLPIEFQFPNFYEEQGKDWRLPPSFEATFLGVPAMFVRCLYTLEVTIMRTRSYRLASWNTNKT